MSSNDFTEEEQGRYDRQIRLWGIEAQQRMRNATILVVQLRGTATEAIKNIVLAGIGKLIIVDGEEVTEEDLGAGFFFRDEDVGKKRVEAAKARIESLNPLVTVETAPTFDVLGEQSFESTIRDVDLVCVTDWPRDDLIRMNEVCRRARKPFYSGGTYDRSAPKESQKAVKMTATYPSLKDALRHRWNDLTRRQTKELNPSCVFALIALWQYQSLHGAFPKEPKDAAVLQEMANSLLSEAGVNTRVLTSIPPDVIESLSTTAAHEFSPVCAIVGGMLGQDILKTLGAREPPIANFFTFDGSTGSGTVCRMNMP